MYDREELIKGLAPTAASLEPYVRQTPLIDSPDLSSKWGRPIFLKLENLQHGGSFKFRPAINNIITAGQSAATQGVVTASSGNFAGAVALAAQMMGVGATIIMRPSASEFKKAKVEALGAEVVICEDDYEAREQTVGQLARERRLIRLHPHDSEPTILADATVAMEILEQCPRAETIVVPTSGAGLLGGICLAAHNHNDNIRVIGVQPEANGTLRRSLDRGRRVGRANIDTVADGLTAAIPGELGFAITQDLAADVVTVSEESLLEATKLIFEKEGQLMEPAAAAPLAALLEGKVALGHGPTVLVATGGNVSPQKWASWVSR